MNRPSCCVLGLFGLLCLSGVANGASNASIEFAEKLDANNYPSGDTCTLKIEEGNNKYNFKGGSNNDCKNDQMSYFKLNDAPSSTIIGLYAEKDCRTTNKPDWYYKLRVYINPLSSDWIPIPELKGKEASAIFRKGLRIETAHFERDNIKGKLSCVSILLE